MDTSLALDFNIKTMLDNKYDITADYQKVIMSKYTWSANQFPRNEEKLSSLADPQGLYYQANRTKLLLPQWVALHLNVA